MPSWHLIYNQSLGRGFLSTYSPLRGVWRTEPHSGAPLPFHPIVTLILLFLFIFPRRHTYLNSYDAWGARTGCAAVVGMREVHRCHPESVLVPRHVRVTILSVLLSGGAGSRGGETE